MATTGITLGGKGGGAGANNPKYFFLPKKLFWLLSLREANKKTGVTLGERGVRILNTVSNQS